MTTSNVICNTTTNVKASAAPSAAGTAVVGDVTGSEGDAHVAILSLIPLLAGCGVCVCVCCWYFFLFFTDLQSIKNKQANISLQKSYTPVQRNPIVVQIRRAIFDSNSVD